MVKIYIVAFVILTPFMANSQKFERIGFQVNPNYSFYHGMLKQEIKSGFRTLSGSEFTSVPRVKFAGSLIAQRNLSESWDLQYRLGYINKGQEIHFHEGIVSVEEIDGLTITSLLPSWMPNPNSESGKYEFISSLHYLELSAHGRYTLRSSSPFRLFVSGGFNLNILFSTEDNYDYYLIDTGPRYEKWMYTYMPFDFSLSASLGHEWESGTGNFSLAITTERGLIPFISGVKWQFYENMMPARHQNFGLALAYTFPYGF